MFIVSNGGPRRSSPLSNLGCLIFGVIGLVALFYILKGLFTLLWWASPVLFVLALIIDWRAVAGAGRSLLELLGRNPIAGIVTAALAVVGFPILALYLFVSALGHRKIKQMQQDFSGAGARREETGEEDFTEYEELESTPKRDPQEEEDIFGAPPPQADKQPDNPYEGFFK